VTSTTGVTQQFLGSVTVQYPTKYKSRMITHKKNTFKALSMTTGQLSNFIPVPEFQQKPAASFM
jgi:hypothetical protein